jgi:hypothetical protein
MKTSVYQLRTKVRGGADGQILMFENINLHQSTRYKGEKK